MFSECVCAYLPDYVICEVQNAQCNSEKSPKQCLSTSYFASGGELNLSGGKFVVVAS